MTPALYTKILGFKIHSFHFFGVLGYILGTTLGITIASQLNLQPLIVLLMAGIGAATFFLLAFVAKWITGEETIVYYHHEIAILVFCALTLYLLKLPILPYIDIALLGIGVFLAFGRIGCYSVGCCHGRPHKHGVKYGQQHVDAGFTWFYKDVPLLPVQLIESVYVFFTVISGVILLLFHAVPGTVLIVYTVVYGLMRFILEFFRGDPDRPLLIGLSEAQWTTMVLTAITFFMSRINWLPVYNWHWIILSVMLIVSLVTMFLYKKNAGQKFLFAKHVEQLAEGLNLLERVNRTPYKKNTEQINIFKTSRGLAISCGHNHNEFEINYFTISSKNKREMNFPIAEKIAKLISTLKKYEGDYELIEKQNGVYHILFKSANK